MMNHIGKTCPYCQFPLKADSEAVECPVCKVPHHRECWSENGGCTTFGCREKSYRPVAGGDRLEVSFDEPSGREAAPARGGGINKLLAAALVITLLAFTGVVFAYINLLGERSAALPGDIAAEPSQVYDPAIIAALDADYYIDYENGTIPIGELPIGTRVVDPSWEWEFRTGFDYAREAGDQTKPVTWLVVAKDHYDIKEPHVTLLAEDLIGLYPFDNSMGRGHEYDEYGYNHWGDSGTFNATRGLRPWLNSSGIHANEGFYRAFSADFKRAVLTTTLPNKEWKNGSGYNTSDNVFIPSATELGDEEHNFTYRIGTVYPYFDGAGHVKRVARLDGETWWYWTRSPASDFGTHVRYVLYTGEFYYNYARNSFAVRPALNLKSGILVSEITH